MVDTIKTPLLAAAGIAQSYYLDAGQAVVNLLIGIATFIYIVYKIKVIQDEREKKANIQRDKRN